MIVLDILEFASSSFVNFLITFLLFSLPAWGIANFRLIEINLHYGIDDNQLTDSGNKEED